MNGPWTYASFPSTSAAGAMPVRPAAGPILVGCMLVGLATSTAHALPAELVLRAPRLAEQTTAGLAVAAAKPPGATIGELRRLSGLTWEQLARLCGVSRRALHFWASGKAMAPGNEEHLQRLLALVRQVDRGSASANRALLLGACEDGSLPLDLLAAGDYEGVLGRLGPGEARRSTPPPLSAAVRAARLPPAPEELAGALQDRVHPSSGRLRAAKAIAVPRRR